MEPVIYSAAKVEPVCREVSKYDAVASRDVWIYILVPAAQMIASAHVNVAIEGEVA